MSRSLFSVLAAAVTVGGLAVVVSVSRLARAISPSGRRLFTCALLITYGAALTLRPPAWPVIDLAVLAGAVGGVLLIEGGLQTPASVAVFLRRSGGCRPPVILRRIHPHTDSAIRRRLRQLTALPLPGHAGSRARRTDRGYRGPVRRWSCRHGAASARAAAGRCNRDGRHRASERSRVRALARRSAGAALYCGCCVLSGMADAGRARPAPTGGARIATNLRDDVVSEL